MLMLNSTHLCLNRTSKLFRNLSTEVEPKIINETIRKPPSKRQQFRNIKFNPSILNNLDNLHLGFIPNRRGRVKFARKFDALEKNMLFIQSRREKKESPHVFRKVGTKLAQISTAQDSFLLKFEKDPPEVAIMGRSNVGKSSLLNSLLGFNSSFVQKASVSPKPGETKDICFYGVRMKKKPVNQKPGEIVKEVFADSNQISETINSQSLKPMSLIIADMVNIFSIYLIISS